MLLGLSSPTVMEALETFAIARIEDSKYTIRCWHLFCDLLEVFPKLSVPNL
jgi:hypothetical protein